MIRNVRGYFSDSLFEMKHHFIIFTAMRSFVTNILTDLRQFD